MATSNVRRAAVLLTCLPQDDAAKLMSRLDPKQVEAVSIEIARLGMITGDEQESAIKDFADANPSGLAAGSGGMDLAKKLVEQALGSKASGTLDNVRQQIEAVPFGFLQRIDSQNLLTFMMDEHPQTIALILSHVPAQLAADVISGLPADRQLAVVRRIANMGQTSPEILQEVEQGLEVRMASLMNQQLEAAGGVPRVAEILNVTDRPTERALLENLAQEAPDLVEEIRRRMFVFEDISKFSSKDIQTMLKNVESSQWAMALKGCPDPLKEKILGNMSKRAGDLLKEEMDYLGPVRSSAVQSAQQQIVDVVRRLEESGEIALGAAEEAEEFIS
jgi:flagellar motor switch protein FliG